MQVLQTAVKKVKKTNHSWPCMGCRSFATPYTPDPLYDDEAVGFNKGYRDTFTVKELYEMIKNESDNIAEFSQWKMEKEYGKLMTHYLLMGKILKISEKHLKKHMKL